MSNGQTFDAAADLIPAGDIRNAIVAKRERILTGFGAVKTAERATKGGVSFGSASAGKAATWAGIDATRAGVFASAWSLAVALDNATK
ncbi:MAG: hypothetical protein EBR82_56250 [Caulobacteraceae bacterium]|nr:hypothetical protein [Caulobacteraceae bacterium]